MRFISRQNIKTADGLLDEGIERARELLAGRKPWMTKTGPVVRGFISRLDGSIQPYCLDVPVNYFKNKTKKHRLDVWLHGRGETQLEIGFLAKREKMTKYPSQDYFTLHPFGRYSNAFKFAGEVDVFEALAHVRKSYNIDANRISNRGFSMGGAGCWQLAVHYADQWFASNPGAGFSETPEFLKHFQQQTLNPTWYEKKLWSWYDCPGYVINLKHCPTIAYSGEIDIQRQAAEMMEAAHDSEGMKLLHIIGPDTKHKIHPESHDIIREWMA